MKNAARIQALKDAGYRVHVSHQRTLSDRDDGLLLPKHMILGNYPCGSIGQRGGLTTVLVERDTPHGLLSREGVAHCNPKDPFNRRLGLTIALNRLEKELETVV